MGANHILASRSTASARGTQAAGGFSDCRFNPFDWYGEASRTSKTSVSNDCPLTM